MLIKNKNNNGGENLDRIFKITLKNGSSIFKLDEFLFVISYGNFQSCIISLKCCVIFLLSLLWPYWPGLALEGGVVWGGVCLNIRPLHMLKKVILAWIITKIQHLLVLRNKLPVDFPKKKSNTFLF